ncbi:hypothetical protein PCC8801_2979 [Rippkaea orientalis PCC 8801]|uniref:Uncharacterized protein n=1 Tax=Rippkaea orientalis (strain PCC 8801 / RF-1) TaxID=41431 RepID=B7JWC3_RIPO1|nr:hypothetical protein [Rippkaea orientalis]ACK66968.1 hypothetical protein PCC8801_2979 [Rippkaea orientalis PCC 8801]
MRKQQIQYTSPLDALVAVAKRLSLYENQHNMDSEDFFDSYSKGQLSDEAIFIDWANDYRHYLGLHQELENRLQNGRGQRPLTPTYGGSIQLTIDPLKYQYEVRNEWL